jgi:hypothetical protein
MGAFTIDSLAKCRCSRALKYFIKIGFTLSYYYGNNSLFHYYFPAISMIDTDPTQQSLEERQREKVAGPKRRRQRPGTKAIRHDLKHQVLALKVQNDE